MSSNDIEIKDIEVSLTTGSFYVIACKKVTFYENNPGRSLYKGVLYVQKDGSRRRTFDKAKHFSTYQEAIQWLSNNNSLYWNDYTICKISVVENLEEIYKFPELTEFNERAVTDYLDAIEQGLDEEAHDILYNNGNASSVYKLLM